MELVDSAIFIQGLVWTTLLLSRPVHQEKRLAGFFIGVISIMTLVEYFSGYTLQDKRVVLDIFMLILFLVLHVLILFFFHEITFLRYSAWSWSLAGMLVLFAGIAFLVRTGLAVPGGACGPVLIKGCVLAIPFSTVLYSLIIYYLYLLKRNDAGGRWNNRKSIVSLSLLAGLSVTWILLLLSEWPLQGTGHGMQMSYWKIPLAVTLFVFGFLEVTSREQRSTTVRRPEREVSIENAMELKKVMEEERLYTDCELTLEKMADRLKISPADLTWMLNHELGTSFYTLVNGYRVKEVQRKLEAKDQRYYTLLAIAFECGFNSKSTFNRVFKEFTGVTPSNYRDSAVHQTPR